MMADTEKKPGFFARISRSIRDMRGEMKKVVWPSRKQILNNTLVVLAAVAISAIFIGGLDSLLGLVVRFVLGR